MKGKSMASRDLSPSAGSALDELADDLRRLAAACDALIWRSMTPGDCARLVGKRFAYTHAAELVAALSSAEQSAGESSRDDHKDSTNRAVAGE